MAFIPQYEPLIQKEYADAVYEQIMSGWIGPGEKVQEFETKICEITGAKHCIAVNSGTTALYISILALFKQDYYIKFPDYTFLAGANAARLARHHVDLVDINENTLCMNPHGLDYLLKDDRNAGIIFVNHNGYVGKDRYLAKEKCGGLPMIEDSSQALGIWDENGLHAGRVGDVGIFSFSVPKLITTGQGGCIITDNDKVAKICDQLRDQGGNWRKTKVHNEIGGNFKFNDILAAYGLAQLNKIDELLLLRKQIFGWYRKHIKIVDFGYDSTWMVLYRTKNAINIINKLKENNIQSTQYYNPIHTNPSYKFESHKNFPMSVKAAKEIVYLPSSLNLKEEDIDKICSIILEVDKRNMSINDWR